MNKSIAALLILVPALLPGAAPVIDHMVTASGYGAYAGTCAPGSWLEIYGSNLAGTSRAWAGSDFTGANAPTTLDGVTVTVNGTPAYVSYVSPGQVNVQLPDALSTGTAAVVLSYQGAASTAASLTVNAQQPGLLAPSSFNVGGKQYMAAAHTNGSLIVPPGITGLPVSETLPGEAIVLYGIGFGALKQGIVGGVVAGSQNALAGTVTVKIGNANATVLYAGISPGSVGLYQINVVVPQSLSLGDAAVQVSLNGTVLPQTLYLPVGVAVPTTPGAFTLTSSAGANGGTLPNYATCDGMGSTIPLAWANAPAGTKEFALLMTTLPGDGTTKWNWVVYHIPSTQKSLPQDAFLIGTMGVGSDGSGTVYNPPCSQGPGLKLYTFTLYALSDVPVFSVPAAQVTGQNVTDAIGAITLGSASLTLGASRTTMTGSGTACTYISNSLKASKSGAARVSCDDTYGYISSLGITTQPMMNGITSTNLQVPTPTNFQGANGWKIPLAPKLAATPTDVVDGPLGVAINGVPIFNPCTQGGCVTGGDTKALGQLDNCNGHSGRADDYHYHAAPTCMMADQPPSYWDTHPIGWALDGFAIFGYHDADGTTAQRDTICGGNTKTVQNAPQGYSYHVTDASPYVASCLAGVPSPDLAGQGAKYHPMRQPPVTPFNNTNMTLTTAADGYQVLQFTSARAFVTNETGTDSYNNAPGTYRIRYKELTGSDLATALAQSRGGTATACWTFQFTDVNGVTTQPTVSYCK